MKKFFGVIGGAVVCLVFIPLFLASLFAFPIEFAAATWHGLRVDSTTEGVITKSEARKSQKGLKVYSITYSYEVHGRNFESTRRRGGFFSDSSRQSGGGEFAKEHPVGTEVTVYYDSSDPGFSLLEHGWPKGSIGFSISIWGLLFSNYFKRTDRRTIRLLFAYPISRAAVFCGLITLMAFPLTIDWRGLIDVLILFAVISLLALVWLLLGKPDPETPASIQN